MSPRARLLLVTLAALFWAAAPAHAASDLAISQVYSGGGNTGASFQNDYVELFNRGTIPVSLTGRSVQYASATGAPADPGDRQRLDR